MIKPNLPPPDPDVKSEDDGRPDPDEWVKRQKEDADIAKLECPDCHGSGACPKCLGLVDGETVCSACDDGGQCTWCNGDGDNPDIKPCDYGEER